MYENLDLVKDLVMAELELDDEPSNLEPDLMATAGITDAGALVYRPYFYCAHHLDSSESLDKAKGSTAFRVAPRVLGYFKRQAMLDKALKLTVPPGAEAVLEGVRMTSVPVTVVF